MRTADCLTCEGTDTCYDCDGTGRCHAEEHDEVGSGCYCSGFGECSACDGTGTCPECEGSCVERALNTGPSLEEAFDKLVETLEVGNTDGGDDHGGKEEPGPL